MKKHESTLAVNIYIVKMFSHRHVTMTEKEENGSVIFWSSYSLIIILPTQIAAAVVVLPSTPLTNYNKGQ